MRYPTLPVQKSSREMVEYFKGYNHNLRIAKNEFFDMTNMTSDCYPVLSPRGVRGVYAKPASPQGLIAKDRLCYVDGDEFVAGEERVDMGLSVATEDCPKQLVSMGAYVIILPDKKYINTMDLSDFGDIEASWVSRENVTFSLCTITGEEYGETTASAEAPENPENQALWIDTSTQPHTLKKYAASSEQWVSIATTYIRISSPGIGKSFEQYDGVTVSGVIKEGLQDLNAVMVVMDRGDDYIVVIGILDAVTTQTTAEGSVSVERKMPVMDFVVESKNRLWGCRYGEAANGTFVNEIYASKLGDFKNWSCYMGLSTDSYTASRGTDGPFTGAVSFQDGPLFFKENWMHKVYGTYPANYQIQDIACRGVQPGCSGSLAIVNEVLYYKARKAVCAYDGSLPVEISENLGTEMYTDAVGGGHGSKYYISMRDSTGAWQLFVYDAARAMWHREDNLHVEAFCSCKGDLYCVDADGRNIITLNGSGKPYEDAVTWMVETGEIGISTPDMKYISRLTIRLAMENLSKMDIYAQYDMDGEWLHVCNIRGTSLRSFSVPIRPRRCDYMKLRMEGIGGAKIYSITKTIEQGSDIS